MCLQKVAVVKIGGIMDRRVLFFLVGGMLKNTACHVVCQISVFYHSTELDFECVCPVVDAGVDD